MKKDITIGLFMDSFYPMLDGVCITIDNYATRLSEYGNVIVFVPECKGEEYDDSKFPYKVVRCKATKKHIIDYGLPLPHIDRKFMKEVNNSNLDIVHIHSPFSVGKVGIEYAKKHHVPVVGTMHTQFKKDVKKVVKFEGVTKFVNSRFIKQFNRCDECWAVNSEVAKIYHNDYKYKQMPEVMNNATEMKPVEDVEKAKEFINQKHNLSADEKVFLFVGRMDKLKNILFIVDSLKKLKEMKPSFKFKMLFVGNGIDEDELKASIKNNGMENEIIMCGKVSNRELLAKYYARADLFLFPSLYDASSLVQIEAASQHTPTLFLEGAATTATITANRNGFLSKNSIDSYAENIMNIMNDTELYNKVCENCFNEVYVNWDDQIKNVYEKYIELIEENKKNIENVG